MERKLNDDEILNMLHEISDDIAFNSDIGGDLDVKNVLPVAFGELISYLYSSKYTSADLV